MSRAVYIGGFGNGRTSANNVGEALQRHGNFEEVDVFTFGEAYKDKVEIAKATKRVHVVCHSAGMMALVGADAEYIHAFNAPLPTGRLRLFMRTGLKTAQMHASIRSREALTAVAEFDASSFAELAVHSFKNLKPFLKGDISRFDAVQAASEAAQNGTGVTLTYTDRDAYFNLSHQDENRAKENGVRVEHALGMHDELPLYPDEMLGHYFNQLPKAS